MSDHVIVNGITTSLKCTAIAEVWTYDVWGNARDGFDVNDRSCRDRAAEFECTAEVSNMPICPGAKDDYRQFPAGGSFSAELAISFRPTDKAIAEAFGYKPRQVEIDGDDLRADVTLKKNGRPIGEIIIVRWRAADGREFDAQY